MALVISDVSEELITSTIIRVKNQEARKNVNSN
jgi:hypothetical protein